MAVKSSISLTDEQHTIARALVEAGHYASLNAILLRQRVDDAEELETVALRELLSRREAYSNGPIEGGTPSLRGMTPGSGLPS
ncbi:MAG: type II toxin-antitoxin system ParD family antitoxin [Gammaproteobacteria bacterium]|nr:type II toxin-antitoxin system ParD family antitoxin [Gammaproteobacteria bacterium]